MTTMSLSIDEEWTKFISNNYNDEQNDIGTLEEMDENDDEPENNEIVSEMNLLERIELS